MRRDILAIDVGTSGLKLGVFGPDLEFRVGARRSYNPHLHGNGRADIDPAVWWEAIRSCCAEVAADLAGVGIVSLSVTTPGLTPMTADGSALAPAVLFLDGRSHEQARRIRELVGEETFLEESANLPVSGGSSLASILWFRDEEPAIWDATAKFGHCNTYIVRRMTGRWAIDPSTTSITGMYNTVDNDLRWNEPVLRAAGIPLDLLPPLMLSYDSVGSILPGIAEELGLPDDCVVLCGGNDATLAALSGGITEPGDISIISGTCDIVSVCTMRPIASPEFNLRCHVIPGRWLTFYVLNAGGEGLEWFRRVFCRELDANTYYEAYVPGVLAEFLADPDVDERERDLPRYDPHIGGSRYSIERLKGGFSGVTLQTGRDDLLVSLVRGNMAYLGQHLTSLARSLELGPRIGLSGGGAQIRGMLEARRRWTGPFDYHYQDQSSMVGAAMLGQIYETGRTRGRDRAPVSS